MTTSIAAEPSISVRNSIRWLPDEASEPTSTLVLTGSSRRFVDVRIFRPREPDEPELPNEGGPMSRLEWAFAGTSSSSIIPPEEEGDPPTSHSEWVHWVDSKTDQPATDEGDMFPLPDGVHTLECGRMVNPDTGLLTEYEELWTDDEVEATEGKGEGEGDRWSVVLSLDDKASGAKGMVVRVGQWCQGIIKVQDEVCVERWQWGLDNAQGDVVEGDWKRVARLGRLFMPCSLTFTPEKIHEGSKVAYGDYSWDVQELISW